MKEEFKPYIKSKNAIYLISGGIWGALSWASTYPFDTIKTKI